MAQRVYRVDELPESAIAASATFYRDHLEAARAMLAGSDDLAIVLPAAAHDHHDWRLAIVRDLARAHAPARVNLVTAEGDAKCAVLLAYLDTAPGVTGQVLDAE